MTRGRHPVERVSDRCVFEDRGYHTPCRIFTGPKDANGYGQIQTGKTTKRTHIVTYEFSIGRVPAGLELDHLCKQKDCCATSHLEAVTHRENVRRGRVGEVTRARAAAVTHCPRGHAYTEENTLIIKHRTGYLCRACKECNRERMRRNYRIRKAAAAALVTSCLLLIPAGSIAATHARMPSTVAPPTAPCDADHVLDIYIIDGVLFECGCDHMMFGPPVCEWYEVTSQADDPTRFRRVIKWARAKHLHVSIIRRFPGVVA